MSEKFEKATLGGGCFWCLEAIYQRVKGVSKVESGYAGGDNDNPNYREVCSGTTNHAEVIQITFDSEVISFEEILFIFWRIHDPTTLNRQGADVGTQYRSVVYFHDENQKEIALKSKSEAENAKIWSDPIVTEISPLTKFFKAEEYHQNYFNDNSNQPYCRAVIEPKVRKFMEAFSPKA